MSLISEMQKALKPGGRSVVELGDDSSDDS